VSLTTAAERATRLVEASANGDRQAFAQLFELYAPRVFATAFRFTRNHSAASDVTQEVFVRLLSRIGQYRGESAFTSWLHRIVANVAMDFARASRRFDAIDAHAGTLSMAAPQEAACAREQRDARVRAAVARLSPRLRAPMVLRYVGGLSYEEIGRVLKLSPGTVASRLARAHVRVARDLEHWGIG
jgi:RNA polymerase sigma factor (sigma-70 family)